MRKIALFVSSFFLVIQLASLLLINLKPEFIIKSTADFVDYKVVSEFDSEAACFDPYKTRVIF